MRKASYQTLSTSHLLKKQEAIVMIGQLYL
jgi:hypothetical protein